MPKLEHSAAQAHVLIDHSLTVLRFMKIGNIDVKCDLANGRRQQNIESLILLIHALNGRINTSSSSPYSQDANPLKRRVGKGERKHKGTFGRAVTYSSKLAEQCISCDRESALSWSRFPHS